MQKFENSSETNSLPLSLNTFDGLPKIFIQFWRKFLIIIVGLLLLVIVTLLNRVNSSIIWKYQNFLSRLWRSNATVWLNVAAVSNPTTGLGGGSYGFCILSQTSFISFEISVKSNHAFFKRFFKLLGKAWPNCSCNCTSFERFLYLTFIVSNIKQSSMESKIHIFSGKTSTAVPICWHTHIYILIKHSNFVIFDFYYVSAFFNDDYLIITVIFYFKFCFEYSTRFYLF